MKGETEDQQAVKICAFYELISMLSRAFYESFNMLFRVQVSTQERLIFFD